VAAYLVPQVKAHATLAGLQPMVGLWAALSALVVYAVLGSSPPLSIGPEATTAPMTAIAIGPLAAGKPARYAELAVTLALLVGVMGVAVIRRCLPPSTPTGNGPTTALRDPVLERPGPSALARY
jgi:MFS superfamily sulfate permease-like transporter